MFSMMQISREGMMTTKENNGGKLLESSKKNAEQTKGNGRQGRNGSKRAPLKDLTSDGGKGGRLSASTVRQKSTQKDRASSSGKKKTNTMSPAVLDVVFGKVQSPSTKLEDLCRKRDEDTIKCGRISKTIANESN